MSGTRNILEFLKALAVNNSREWMQGNKSIYLEQKESFHAIVQHVIEGISGFDPKVLGLESKDSVFRINRDIRFSKDKTLYKTHFGAYMATGGRKSMLPGYYLHLESANKSFLAAGLYRPGNDLLHKVRQEIDYNGQQLVEIVENKSWKDQFGQLEGERLKRAPKGYALDHPLINYLQMKSFLAVFALKDSEVTAPDFLQDTITRFRQMHPLVNFLNTAIS